MPKLVCPRLAAQVTAWLRVVVTRGDRAPLAYRVPADPMMWVSHETIYQALFVQGREGCAGSWPAACALAERPGALVAATRTRAASPTWS